MALIAASMLDVRWEMGVEDALDAVRAQGYEVPTLVRGVHSDPDVVVVCYPASAHSSDYVRDLLDRAVRGSSRASRIGVAACDYSSEEVSDADVAQLAAVHEPQHTVRVYDPTTLAYTVQAWVRAHARQLGASPATTPGDTGGELPVRTADVEGEEEAECDMNWF